MGGALKCSGDFKFIETKRVAQCLKDQTRLSRSYASGQGPVVIGMPLSSSQANAKLRNFVSGRQNLPILVLRFQRGNMGDMCLYPQYACRLVGMHRGLR
jgi:hypothetical protein